MFYVKVCIVVMFSKCSDENMSDIRYENVGCSIGDENFLLEWLKLAHKFCFILFYLYLFFVVRQILFPFFPALHICM